MFKLSSCLQIKVRIYTEKKKKKKSFLGGQLSEDNIND